MKIVNKNMFVCLAATFFMVSVPQQSYGQGWLKKLSDGINKGLESVNKAFGSSSSGGSSSVSGSGGQGTGSSSSASSVSQGDRNTARYKIHTTAQTKTMTIDGGVSYLGQFSNGRAIIYRHTIAGFTIDDSKGLFVIDSQGNKVFDIPAGYTPKGTRQSFVGDDSNIGFDSNRLMVFSRDKKSAIIYDENGNIVKEFSDVSNASGYKDGVAVILRYEKKAGSWTTTDVWYHIDVNGNVLSNTMPANGYSGGPTYRVFPLREGLAPVYQEKVGWGYRNAQCQWAINPTFGGFGADDGGGFYNGLSRAQRKEDKKWGFINSQGQWVIQPTYTNRPGNFYTKYALVTDKAGRSYFIDQTGKFVWEQPAERITIREFMPTGYAIWTYQSGCYIIDSSFNKVAKMPSNGVIATYNDSYFQWNGDTDEKRRLYDWNGNLLLEFYGTFSEGICSQDNYYFNDKGEVIVKFEDTKF